MVIVILFVLGLCLGSFVNAFVWRFHEQADLQDELAGIPTKKAAAKAAKRAEIDKLSIAKGRSMCVHCKHELAPKDLVPVASYVLLRGRCRYCRKPIQDTPLAELVTPLLFVVSYLFWPLAFNGAGLVTFCFWLLFLVGFVALSLYDIRWYELPHKIVLPLIGLAVLQTAIVGLLLTSNTGGGVPLLQSAGLGGLLGGGLFYILYKVSPKQTLDDGSKISAWIGGGDITLGLLLGLLVGGPGNALLLIFVASLLGTVVALPLMIAGKASRTSHLPFGPYLMLAAVIVMLWGNKLISWYLSQFAV